MREPAAPDARSWPTLQPTASDHTGFFIGLFGCGFAGDILDPMPDVVDMIENPTAHLAKDRTTPPAAIALQRPRRDVQPMGGLWGSEQLFVEEIVLTRV
ncbi:hypothetical protein GXY_02943 [Novacetimonas hansenii ATCC 23769]|uniref:Uncharacterized protein n=1 Tax=Novacetimonas hansenii ATCC 23769 TaxID=714995 RepID=D5QBU2_NOVHA|nr:hypothetical protein GXY_02943 [Novacetimonas hansenii ATCC 23769]